MAETRPILLYDGLCAFCNGAVQFVLRRDKTGTMQFAPLQGSTAAEILQRHPEVRNVDSLILVTSPGTDGESVTIRSDAVLGIARYVGGIWRAVGWGRVVPRIVRDWGYALFARYRYKVFGRCASCPLPSAEQRARFLP